MGHDVPVDDQRNIDRIPHGANRLPVCFALVELAARTAMHRDQLHTGILCATRQFWRVDRAMIPAKTHFQSYRYAHGANRRLDQRQRMIEIAHQRRTGLASSHMACRTAHVNVDNVRACGFRDPRAFGHPARLAACQLHDVRSDARRLRTQQRHRPAARKVVTGGHF